MKEESMGGGEGSSEGGKREREKGKEKPWGMLRLDMTL